MKEITLELHFLVALQVNHTDSLIALPDHEKIKACTAYRIRIYPVLIEFVERHWNEQLPPALFRAFESFSNQLRSMQEQFLTVLAMKEKASLTKELSTLLGLEVQFLKALQHLSNTFLCHTMH